MRTYIEIKQDIHQTEIKKGDVGYIDGYVCGADGRPYAAVVIPKRELIDLVPTHCIKYQSTVHSDY